MGFCFEIIKWIEKIYCSFNIYIENFLHDNARKLESFHKWNRDIIFEKFNNLTTELWIAKNDNKYLKIKEIKYYFLN